MSKSVLVIDYTPENCYDCPIGQDYRNILEASFFCLGAGKCVLDKEAEMIPNQCPLKPLPEKKEYIIPIDNVEANKDIIAVGWNACINEITGGK